MKPKLTALALLAFLPISPATAADLAEGARSMLGNAVAAMRSISAGGGYLWRYSDDLTKRVGEKKAAATAIWMQPRGTPSVGLAFLRAHEASG